MRIFSPLNFALILFVLLNIPLAPQRPYPRTERRTHDSAIPPLELPSAPHAKLRVDTAQLKREAAELTDLADTIPGQIDQVGQSQLPKDLNDNLRRIEKLAKHLRKEVSPR